MTGYIKDADCTKDTPVVYGRQERNIYGREVRFRPRVPGKRKTSTDKKTYLPRLLPLEDYDLIIVLFSGGKDSLAAYLNGVCQRKKLNCGTMILTADTRKDGWTGPSPSHI